MATPRVRGRLAKPHNGKDSQNGTTRKIGQQSAKTAESIRQRLPAARSRAAQRTKVRARSRSPLFAQFPPAALFTAIEPGRIAADDRRRRRSAARRLAICRPGMRDGRTVSHVAEPVRLDTIPGSRRSAELRPGPAHRAGGKHRQRQHARLPAARPVADGVSAEAQGGDRSSRSTREPMSPGLADSEPGDPMRQVRRRWKT